MTRDEEIYAAVLETPATDRGALLDRACGGNAALRARVEALLLAGEEADAYFAEPAIPRAPALPEEKPGDRIGRYKLLQKIGEGGCGVVYMAEQQEPVRRRVALKVIKLGMDTKAVIARFEAERQALALMEHPNIARVLDAGATEIGRPFFVMELVRGVPITRYCDEENLPTAERLGLFVQVCHAIQHAHEKGIIHRDIKPSNILVTMHDDVAVPKVIDFGIAKATQGKLTDQTVFTAFEQFLGTPAYMSPEQAQMSDLEVDARSDIYSLGVLLYELLVGRPPFDPRTLVQSGIDEVRRIIREVEPPTPSTRLNSLGAADRAAIAARRGTAPAQLSTVVRGDLDWIAMKALEKNRVRRYATASAFADDVKRHLVNEPVVARPPSAAYRALKFTARHKFGLIAAAAVIFSLGAGLTLSRIVLGEKYRPEKARSSEQAKPPTSQAQTRGSAEPSYGNAATLKTLFSGTDNAANGILSPDESAVVYIDWNGRGGNLAVRELRTGETRTLTAALQQKDAYEFALDPVWSSDSKSIAYSWSDDDGANSLRITARTGGEPKIIRRGKTEGFAPSDWSRDGKTLLLQWSHYDTDSRPPTLATADVATGEFRVIGPEGAHARFSPDARSVVCERIIEGKRDVFVSAVDGARNTRITAPRAEHGCPIFSPAGDYILFSGNERGTWDLWAVKFDGHATVGAPFPVRYDFGDHHKWMTAAGKLAFRISGSGVDDVISTDVYEVAATAGNAAKDAPPTPIAKAFFGRNLSPVWSPDGGMIAYVRFRGAGSRHPALCVLSLSDGIEHVYDSGMRQISRLFWSPDSQTIALRGIGEERSAGPALYLFPLATHTRLPERIAAGLELGFARNGKEFLFYDVARNERIGVDIVTRIERRTAAPAGLARIKNSLAQAYDAIWDESTAIYVAKDAAEQRLIIADANFENQRIIARVQAPHAIQWPTLSPNRTKIAYHVSGGENYKSKQLHLAALDGSSDRVVDTGRKYLFGGPAASWSPDSTKIVLTLREDLPAEVGVLENFLPLESPVAPGGLSSSSGSTFGNEASISRDSAGAATNLDALTLRKIPLPTDWLISISADGRYAAHWPKGTSNLAVTEIATGRSWTIAKGNDNNAVWNTATFSRDGRRIAYDLNGASIHVARPDGTDDREVYKHRDSTLTLVGWSTDETELIVGYRGYEVMLNIWAAVNVANGQVREIRRMASPTRTGMLSRPALSANGRHLAYCSTGVVGNLPDGIARGFVLDLTSGVEHLVVEREVTRMVGWSADDANLLFLSERTGASALWGIAMREGRAASPPELVKAGVNSLAPREDIIVCGHTLYCTETKNTAQVYAADADLETGRLLQPARRVMDRFPGFQILPEWSKTGEKLMVDIWDGQKRFVTIVPARDEQKDFPLPPDFRGRIQQYSWSEDGNFVVFLANGNLHRFDLGSGKVETLFAKSTGTWNCMPRLSHDGKFVYYIHREFATALDGTDDWTDRIVRRELASEREEVIYGPAEKINIWCPLALSPDGGRLAFAGSDQYKRENFTVAIRMIALANRSVRELARMAPRENVTSLAWTADGRRLVHNREDPGKNEYVIGQTQVWSLSLDTGESTRIELAERGIRDLAIHPDGHRIAFRAGGLADGRDVWQLDGVPAIAAAPSPPELAPGEMTKDQFGEFLGADRAIVDRAAGFRARIPDGWEASSADRRGKAEGAFIIRLSLPTTASAVILLSCGSIGPENPTTPAELDAVLRKRSAEFIANWWQTKKREEGYQQRGANFASWITNGYHVVSWDADYQRSGRTMTECSATVGREGSRFCLRVSLSAPQSVVEKLRPEWESLVASIELQ